MRRRWGASDLRNASGPPGSVCLKLWTRRTPGAQPPDYLVCATARATGDELDGAVTRELLNGLPRRRASATVGRPSARTVVLRFAQSSVGRPASLRFAVGTQRFGTGCPRSRGCVDDAPDAAGTASLQLRGASARVSLAGLDNADR
jgi:hypothetical protein